MSWNPRRFAASALKTHAQSCGLLMWLTAEAQDRIASALDNQVLELTSDPLPVSGLWLGLADPVLTSKGEVSMVWIPGSGDLARLSEQLRTNYRHQNPAVFDSFGGLEDTSSRFCLAYAFTMRGDGCACVAFYRDTWRNVRSEAGMLSLNERLNFTFQMEDRLILDETSESLIDAIRASWTLLNDPVEAEVSATEVGSAEVVVGKKRKSRDVLVSVIDVRRRASSPSGTQHAVDHDHRWSVRGHWRRQPFGPGRSQRRKIWIEEHIAGPPDKPLRERAKVQLLR